MANDLIDGMTVFLPDGTESMIAGFQDDKVLCYTDQMLAIEPFDRSELTLPVGPVEDSPAIDNNEPIFGPEIDQSENFPSDPLGGECEHAVALSAACAACAKKQEEQTCMHGRTVMEGCSNCAEDTALPDEADSTVNAAGSAVNAGSINRKPGIFGAIRFSENQIWEKFGEFLVESGFGPHLPCIGHSNLINGGDTYDLTPEQQQAKELPSHILPTCRAPKAWGLPVDTLKLFQDTEAKTGVVTPPPHTFNGIYSWCGLFEFQEEIGTEDFDRMVEIWNSL